MSSPNRSTETQGRKPHLERSRPSHSVFVVGAGRLGGALARGLVAAGWKVETWTRSARKVRIPGSRQREGELPESLGADLILLTVPDRVIAPMALLLSESGRLKRGQVVAHCSGALGLDVLAPLRESGVHPGSLHPLASASSASVDLRGHAAAIEGNPKALRLLRRVARDTGLRPIAVDPEQRGLYHASASLAANGLVSLADLATELLVSAGVTQEQALQALLPLFDSALKALATRGLPDALTGPVARGDAAVVKTHLDVLAGRPGDAVYRELSRRALELARAQGKADPASLESVEALLDKRRRPGR